MRYWCKTTLAFFTLAMVALAACKPAAKLAGTSWVLTSYAIKGVDKPALAGTEVSLVFSKDGKVDGRASCNHYFGGYQVSGSALTFHSIGWTEMACTAPGVMEQEQIYLDALQAAKSYTVQGSTLRITGDGGEILVFVAR